MKTQPPVLTRSADRRFALALGLFLLVVAVFYLATLRPGHEWGDDFSLYIRHAMNLVDGQPYAESGYLYDPLNPTLGPRSYPPGFPLLLAPVYALFGLNLAAMKVEIVLLWVSFLGVFGLAFRKRVSRPVLAAALALLAFSPYFWDFKDNILSDIPFLLALFACLWAIDVAVQSERRSLWGALGIGALIALAASIRAVGLVLLPALFLADLVKSRRLRLHPFIAAGAAGALVLLQLALLPGVESYADQLNIDPAVTRNLMGEYFRALGSFWSMGYGLSLAQVVFLATLALAALGFALRLFRKASVFEWFFLGYLATLLLWPSYQGIRLLIPILPLYILYALIGWEALAIAVTKRLPRLSPALFAALPLLIAVLYGTIYSRVDWNPVPYGVLAPNSQALFEYVRAETQPGDVLVFDKPRALALFTGRAVSGYPNPAVDAYLLNYFTNIRAAWVVAAADDDPLNELVRRYPQRFTPVYTNPGFTVYRFAP